MNIIIVPTSHASYILILSPVPSFFVSALSSLKAFSASTKTIIYLLILFSVELASYFSTGTLNLNFYITPVVGQDILSFLKYIRFYFLVFINVLPLYSWGNWISSFVSCKGVSVLIFITWSKKNSLFLCILRASLWN